ncbi:hypothetical protein [Geminocystis sp. NIES-3709]|uniref:hypothetical protein n=1 Tax=Geminocystis sp. NIES-3709 TaxID=1617448 RepID=UPI0005FC9A64|nr:hypothetical protein [Geminocystis sp. NIES-3709]BAQ63678.1 hypothetical protein GM3709_443 [Geminocystis sp. NIES-3709]
MKVCIKCKGTGKILEKRLSEYLNSFDYYPVPCPHCQQEEDTLNLPKVYSLNN